VGEFFSRYDKKFACNLGDSGDFSIGYFTSNSLQQANAISTGFNLDYSQIPC